MMMAAIDGQEDKMDEDKEEDNGDESDAIKFYDHVNGGELDATKVKAARQQEIQYLKKMQVYRKVPKSKCRGSKQGIPIKVRWVDTCKGDGTYRSRLVAKEFN